MSAQAPAGAAGTPEAASPSSVLILTPRWTRDGGVATHAMTSAEALAAAGVRVSAAAARIDEQANVPGVELHHSPRLFDPSATPEQRLGGALGTQPELIHLHQYEDPDVLALMRALAPVVISRCHRSLSKPRGSASRTTDVGD